ncbi:peptidylprolyl isomerase [Portibacter lacus]|uniref:Peptidylprolyl isomerase n=1 Tax=Portibacter lacus TaxID=1099794 RepID=A0AA37WEQ1_9BACT|nr:peptidylprolyl isomerase [Portibacter lacus]GLR16904.1 peptidylprolyl isomerase [Portibacter lacus]
MKYFIGVFTLLLFVTSANAQLKGKVIDKVVAKVGSEYILLSDVEKQFSYLKQSQPSSPPESKCEVIESIIAQKIMVNQAKLDSIEVGDDEVEAQLEFRIENILGQMGNNEEFFVEYYGQTVNEVKEWMREDLKNQLLSERMQAQIINEVIIRPEEVVAFYENIPKDSIPLLNAEVELAEIVIKPEASDSSKDLSYKRLLDIRNQIVNDSADFAALAKQFSDDLGSGSKGGDLGWTKRGSFVSEFEAVAYNLERDEISELVESEFGYHLIQLLDRRGNLIKTRHILITPEVTDSDIERTKQFLDSLSLAITADSISFQAAVKKYSNKKIESYNNNGRMTNPQTNTTFYSTNELPPEIYFGIEELEVNEVSAPIEYQDRKGDPMFRIVQVQSKTKPHIANLKQDYSRLQKFAIESKKNEYFNDWIVSKLNNTYMEIDDLYSGCDNIQNWLEVKSQ